MLAIDSEDTFSKIMKKSFVQQSNLQGSWCLTYLLCNYNTSTVKHGKQVGGTLGCYVVIGFVVSVFDALKQYQWVLWCAIGIKQVPLQGSSFQTLKNSLVFSFKPGHAFLFMFFFPVLMLKCLSSKENPSMNFHLFSLYQRSHRDLSKAKKISLLKLV